MRNRKFTAYYLGLAFIALGVGSAWPEPPGVEKDADRILREMGDYLSTASEYTFRADIAYDEIVDDQMILYGGVVELSLRRGAGRLPDQLSVELDGDAQGEGLSAEVYRMTFTGPYLGVAFAR